MLAMPTSAASRLRTPTGPRRRATRPLVVLAVVLVAAFAINLDTTIVNVALPALNRQLGAGTSALQWVVDAYNLAFAALVLAGGNLGDRYGRRPVLAVGLSLFAAASVVAAVCTSSGELIAVRFVMGSAAALIYPTTLSIITATFPDRTERARAIGAWGAVTGLGVAVGPVAGGALLDHFWWGSIFVALIPVAAAALVGTILLVPRVAVPAHPPLDGAGLTLSIVALGTLVYTIIESPGRGWTAPLSIGGFAVAAAALGAFVLVERSRPAPMLDVRLFANPRFSAASGSVTVAYFSLFGFIFLITQYFQQLRTYGPLSTGVRILPVAMSIAVSSLIGTRLAVRVGNKIVVASGLALLAVAFAWISQAGAFLSYGVIALQMVVLGSGMGLTSAPATESIMGVVRPEQAGAGSAVNDTTREVGGTLGVAVLGSVFSSLYGAHLSKLPGVPAGVTHLARSSFGAGQVAAHQLAAAPGPAGAVLHGAVVSGFLAGLHAACWVAAGVCAAGMLVVAALLPSRPRPAPPDVS